MNRLGNAWEGLLIDFPGEFLEYFFPKVKRRLDPSGYFEITAWEFFSLQSSSGENVSLLFTNRWKDGHKVLLHLHLEAGGRAHSVVEAELVLNDTRVHEFFGVFPITLTVFLLEENRSRMENQAFEEAVKTAGRYSFQEFVYLSDFAEKPAYRLSGGGPFPFAANIQLEYNALRQKRRYPGLEESMHFELKKRLLRTLLLNTFEDRYVPGLFALVDYLLPLPMDLEIRLFEELEK